MIDLKPTQIGVLSTDVTPTDYLFSKKKRVIDIVFAIIGLLITAIVFVVLAPLIKLTSPGPIFYRQNRLTVESQVFQIVKFRSMRLDAESDGNAKWADLDDPRVTFVGRLIRMFYLDELPQFWNVLVGDMSLVGPRPERPEMVNELEPRIPGFSSRVGAKPGITGLAQVNYRYGRDVTDARNKLRFDIRYIERGSLMLDVTIFLRTFQRIFSGPGS